MIAAIRAELGQVDMVIYSMAAPVRVHPTTGVTYRSAIKVDYDKDVDPQTTAFG